MKLRSVPISPMIPATTSVPSTPVVSSLLTFGVFLASHLSGGILQYLETMRKAATRIPGAVPASPVVEWAARLAHWILPDLEIFNVRSQVAHGIALANTCTMYCSMKKIQRSSSDTTIRETIPRRLLPLAKRNE